MPSRLIVNIDEPQEEEEIVVPDTGVLGVNNFGSTSNNTFPIIGAVTLVLFLVAAIAAVMVRVHNKKKIGFKQHDKVVYNELRLKRNFVPRIAGLAVLFFALTFVVLSNSNSQDSANAFVFGGENVDTLSVTVEDIMIDLEVGDEPVFGFGGSEITIDSATQSGYTLLAYINGETTSLIREGGDQDSGIKMLETTVSQALGDNTWGIALDVPVDQDVPVFRGLPTSEEDAMVVSVSNAFPTEAGDVATLYYGVYVTPDLDYGTYEGATINYVAVPHVVTTDDVTVRYHGNGFYFDEEKTQDTNTVVYGETCRLSYIDVSGGCTTVYVGEDTKISKSPNVNNNGSAEHGYDNDLVYIDSVSYDGADMLKVELTYGVESGYDYIYVFKGTDITEKNWYNNENTLAIINDGEVDVDDSEYHDNNVPGSETTLYVDGDSVSFVLSSDESYRYYGYYATISPVYSSRPEDIEVSADTVCHFVKSDNVNTDGEKIDSYSSDYDFLQQVSIPGANRIKVEIDYAITVGTEITVVEGVWNGDWDDYHSDAAVLDVRPENENQANSEEFVVNGSIVTFKMESWEEPIEEYDYGFYARLYPVYVEEHEGTITMQDYSFGKKQGVFERVIAPEDYIEWWYLIVEIEGDSYYGQPWWFDSENQILEYITKHIDYYAGRTVEVYAGSFYEIIYDGNGSTTLLYPDYGNKEWIWNFNYGYIWGDTYIREGYEFIGWNTRPDGSGEWYYHGNEIASEGHLGDTLTLYAQWERL